MKDRDQRIAFTRAVSRAIQLFFVLLLMLGLSACMDSQLRRDRAWVQREAKKREQYLTDDPLLGLRAEAMDERLGSKEEKRANEIAKLMLERGHSPLAGFACHERLREDYAASYEEKARGKNVARYYLQSQAPTFQVVQKIADIETPKLRSVQDWKPADGRKHQIGGLAMMGDVLLLSDRKAARLYGYDQDGRRLEEFGRSLPEGEEESLEEALGQPAVFHTPTALAFHPETERIYVLDAGSHQLMVLVRSNGKMKQVLWD